MSSLSLEEDSQNSLATPMENKLLQIPPLLFLEIWPAPNTDDCNRGEVEEIYARSVKELRFTGHDKERERGLN